MHVVFPHIASRLVCEGNDVVIYPKGNTVAITYVHV